MEDRSNNHLSGTQKEQLGCLLQEFWDIFAAREEDCTRTGLVQHHIDTGEANPIHLRPHRLPLAKRQVAEELIKDMAANGIIEPSDSPWAAPVVMVRKKGGGWHPCVDYRRLNAVTHKDSYPLPRIDDALDYVTGSCWFSSLDLRSGYWQVELAPEARPKTAFTIGQGLWQFKVMPFGLCNAPATFERLMERVLKDIPRTRCVVYLDDLLVHAQNFTEGVHNLREVFLAIRQAGLRLNPAKCTLLARQTQFLGHVISESGVATDPAKVAAVRDWLRSFLGLASYYRRFVKDFATIANPLHRLTDKGKRFEWSEGCAAAFQRLKSALADAPVLAYPDPGQPFTLDTDASNVGVGAVLSQQDETGERVVAYYSCSLSRPERNYCVTRRELLAIILAVRHFRPYLLGTKFRLRTDHASLTWMLNFKQPEGQVARWLEMTFFFFFFFFCFRFRVTAAGRVACLSAITTIFKLLKKLIFLQKRELTMPPKKPQEYEELKKSLDIIQETLKSFMDQVSAKLTPLWDMMEEFRRFRAQNEQRENRVEILEKRLDDVDQQVRMNNVILTGVPIKPRAKLNAAGASTANASASVASSATNTEFGGESLEQQIHSFLTSKGISLDLNTIETCHLLPRRKETDKPAILIRFVNHKHKLALMNQRKNLRGSVVYVNDHLTRRNAEISKHARLLRKRKQIENTWVKGCRIYVKLLGPEDRSKVLVVNTMKDFEKCLITVV
uniref:ribonuclease H n=1 Tax=Oryzias latipes TaxID=8090 RepID=A0A3P9JWP4_ORYLA